MTKKPENRQPFRRRYVIFSLLAGLCIGIAVKLFAVDILFISGDSMKPTLTEGSFVIENKLAYGLAKPFGNTFFFQWSTPKKGDIIIFPINNRFVVKRCVAVEGEPLEFSSESGYSLIVGDETIPLTEPQYQRLKHAGHVPKGMVLALGDNRSVSVDSRDYGFVSVKNILGKIIWK